jgi:hypothetical protein
MRASDAPCIRNSRAGADPDDRITIRSGTGSGVTNGGLVLPNEVTEKGTVDEPMDGDCPVFCAKL